MLFGLRALYLFQGLTISFPQKIAIPLHKLFTLGQIIGSVVGGADFVIFNMGKLSLYRVRVEALLVQDAARKGAEAVRGYSAFVAHALNDSADGCIADKAVGFETETAYCLRPLQNPPPNPLNSHQDI